MWCVRLICTALDDIKVALNEANAGDSRSILSIKGEAKPLSYDHKPQNESKLLQESNNQ